MGEIFEFDSIKEYFSAETWVDLSTLEKIYYRNLKRNYDCLKSSGKFCAFYFLLLLYTNSYPVEITV